MSASAKKRIPIESGFFTIPNNPQETPRLLGSRCRSCAEVFFPRRKTCAKCLLEDCEAIELGPRGSLYTFTYVHFPMFGSRKSAFQSYGVGQVDLPEGPRVQAVLSGERDSLRIGMEMELELETLRENQDGDDVVIFRFRPRVASV